MPSAPEPVRADGFPGVRLHVVTGKGGTGKTTVAAALAVALASRGKRVLLAEVEGRQGISQTFDVPPLPTTETRVAGGAHGGEVVGLAVDAKTALLEYLQLFYKLGRAGGVLERFGAIDFATTIAPGVRDLLLIGRIYEASRRRLDAKHHRGSLPEELAYDAIVLDAPPTGRIPRFLSVGEEVADLARMGPIHSQAGSITEVLHSGATRVHVVTLLEEMPVQETVDAVAELRALGMPVGAVIINQARAREDVDPALDAVDGDAVDVDVDLATDLAADLASVGLDLPDATVDALLDQVREHAERVDLEVEQLAVLQDLGQPLVTVPFLIDGIDLDAITEIADLLGDQGMVP
ncbi:MAG: AAA family ATPase [Actinomycetales bacterium]|nr:AAA family ATPase [Candidatus Phosphoribacter baldrii]